MLILEKQVYGIKKTIEKKPIYVLLFEFKTKSKVTSF